MKRKYIRAALAVVLLLTIGPMAAFLLFGISTVGHREDAVIPDRSIVFAPDSTVR